MTYDIDASDWMRTVEKRGLHNLRRSSVHTASDILGPGFGPYGVPVTDWNADEAAFNGFFWSEPGASHVPYSGWWMGQTIASEDGQGYQEVVEFQDGATRPARYLRTFAFNTGGVRVYSSWQITATDTGRVTSGFASSSGFSNSGSSYRLLNGNDVDLRIEYNCNTSVATSAILNIPATEIGHVPTATEPNGDSWYGSFTVSGIRWGGCRIDTAGAIILTTCSSDLTNTDVIHIRPRYLRS